MIHIQHAMRVPEGDGITVKRLMPVQGMPHFDPFVLWDHFDISGGGFPLHPHRGFEATTWIFSGGMRHKDNLGNEGTVHAGGAQRFTAGGGITHSEMPDGEAAGIQLWINLPQRLKRMDAAYQQVEADALPCEQAEGVVLTHIVGKRGPIRLHTDVEFLQIDLAPGSTLQRDVPIGWRGMVYIVLGQVVVNGEPLHAGQAAFVEAEEALHLKMTENQGETRLMWCFGCPHNEPIHQHGPFVD